MIILETYCGLCNRLRPIQSTLDLAGKKWAQCHGDMDRESQLQL